MDFVELSWETQPLTWIKKTLEKNQFTLPEWIWLEVHKVGDFTRDVGTSDTKKKRSQPIINPLRRFSLKIAIVFIWNLIEPIALPSKKSPSFLLFTIFDIFHMLHLEFPITLIFEAYTQKIPGTQSPLTLTPIPAGSLRMGNDNSAFSRWKTSHTRHIRCILDRHSWGDLGCLRLFLD